jgi:hypothetical protein
MIIVLKPRSAAMTPFLTLSPIKRFLLRRRQPQPFELLDNLSRDAAFKEQMRAFVVDLAERLKGRKPPSSNPMILVRAPDGSGKTFLIRALASALFRLGALHREKPYETWFGDLKAGYIGQSERKSLDHCNAALDGVLSVDDLYGLSDPFGQDAFNTVRRFAVENQRRIVVFFENTPWRAEQFFKACPHLEQAFGRIIEFPALDSAQLWDIFKRLAAGRSIHLPDGAEALVMPVIERAVVENNPRRGYWAGAREMNALLEGVLRLATERVRKSSGELAVPEVALIDIANALAEIDWLRR